MNTVFCNIQAKNAVVLAHIKLKYIKFFQVIYFLIYESIIKISFIYILFSFSNNHRIWRQELDFNSLFTTF